MGVPITLTDSSFEEQVIKSDIPVLIDFWAIWCGPCQMVAPVVAELAQEYDGRLRVGKMDVDSNKAVAMNYGIRSIPTLLLFKNGQVVEQIIGAVSKSQLIEKISPHI